MTKLTDLIGRGPNPARGLPSLVLKNYRQIEQARALLWGWADIADALDLPPGSHSAKTLRAAFARVSQGIAQKRLKAPITTAATAGQAPQARTRTVQPGATPPLPGQKPAPTEGMSEMEKLQAEFDR